MQRKVYKMKRFTAFILLIVMLTLGFASCSADEQMGTGASPYLDERDTTGRRIFFAEFCIEGYGKFVILLDATSAPKTVQHFGALVRQEFYNGKTFHFVNDRVLQGGCPYGDGSGNIASTLEGEFADNGYMGNDIRHKRGVVAMVRGNEYDSASCQFFICRENYYKLDGQYAAFGYVVEGMSVIDEMANYASGFLDTTYDGYDGLIISEYQPRIKYARILDNGWKRP